MWLASQCKVYIIIPYQLAFPLCTPLPSNPTMATYSSLRSRPRGASASVDARAQRRRAVVIDNGFLIPSIGFDTGLGVLTDPVGTAPSSSSSSERGTFNGATYVSIPRSDLDRLMISKQSAQADTSKTPPRTGRIPLHPRVVRHSTPVASSSSITMFACDPNSTSRPRDASSYPSAAMPVELPSPTEINEPIDRAQVPPRHDRQARRGSVSNGRWVLDPRTGFEMYVPPASPRRRLRPRLRSMPAPAEGEEHIKAPLPERRVLKRNRTDEQEDAAQMIRRRRPSQPPPLPPRSSCPIPPSLAPFVAAVNAAAEDMATSLIEEGHNHSLAPSPIAEVPPTPLSSTEARAEEQERQFQALITRDCPDEDLTIGPLSPTSSSFKSSLRKSGGAGGKWSAGLSLGIPAFFRARRNTTASVPDKSQNMSASVY